MTAESAEKPQVNEGNMCKSLIYKGKLIAAASAIHPQPAKIDRIYSRGQLASAFASAIHILLPGSISIALLRAPA